jgi:hypothetical protein
MLPGPSERFVPVVDSALDEDLDPHPCEEDEDFFKNALVDSSLHGSRPHRSRGSLVLVQCSTYQYVLVCACTYLFILVCTGTY